MATVRKFNGTDWEILGNAGISAAVADYIAIAINSERITYIVYKDEGNSNRITVKKYENSVWQIVGNEGFSNGIANYCDIAISHYDIPYVVYKDVSTDKKAVVKRFIDDEWETVGQSGLSESAVYYTSIDINKNNAVPYVVYCDNTNQLRATAVKYIVENGFLEIKKSNFNNYPNPADNIFYLDNDIFVNHKKNKIVIFDISGKQIKVIDNYDFNNGIDTSNLQNGFYVIKIFIKNNIFTDKIIIKHNF